MQVSYIIFVKLRSYKMLPTKSKAPKVICDTKIV